jgi:hypothetical protein
MDKIVDHIHFRGDGVVEDFLTDFDLRRQLLMWLKEKQSRRIETKSNPTGMTFNEQKNSRKQNEKSRI